MMTMTTRDTVRRLFQSVITRLENRKAIEIQPEKRQRILDGVVGQVGASVLTEEDLKNQTLETLGLRSGELVDLSFTETEQYRAARKVVRKTFGEDELHGLFFQKTVKEIAEDVNAFLMKSSDVDEVFEDDRTLQLAIVDIIKKFNPRDLH